MKAYCQMCGVTKELRLANDPNGEQKTLCGLCAVGSAELFEERQAAKVRRMPVSITGSGTCIWVACTDGTIWNNYGFDNRPAAEYWQQSPSIPKEVREMNLTAEQREALGWALDMAYDDQQSYMSYGNPAKDYGDDWPEAAKQKAAYCRSLAEIAEIAGEFERWSGMAEAFEASAEEFQEVGK